MTSVRLRSIDVLRGAIIVTMILVHIWEYFLIAPLDGFGVGFHRWVISKSGALVAPLFVLISGTSTWLGYASKDERGVPWRDIATLNFKRGLALFLFATSVNALMLPFSLDPEGAGVLHWGVIQLIGICVLLTPIYGRLRWPYRALWIAMPLILSAFPESVTWHLDWLKHGFAPPLPWATLFFVGTASAELIAQRQRSLKKSLLLLMAMGVIAVGPIALTLGAIYSPLTWAHWKGVTATSVALYAGCFWMILALFGYLFELRRLDGTWVSALQDFGRRALTIYYIQFALIVGGARIAARITGASPALPWPAFLPLTALVVFALHFAVNGVWAKRQHVGSLEWLLARAIGR